MAYFYQQQYTTAAAVLGIYWPSSKYVLYIHCIGRQIGIICVRLGHRIIHNNSDIKVNKKEGKEKKKTKQQ